MRENVPGSEEPGSGAMATDGTQVAPGRGGGPRLTRRVFIGRSAGIALSVGGLGSFLAACGSSSGGGILSTLNWLTWSDHYFPKQLQEVKAKTGIAGRPQLFSDDSDAYVKVKTAGGQWNMSSEDALWVPKFNDEGLIESFDLGDIPASSQLYSVGKTLPFFNASGGSIAYPFGWSSIQIFYNPKYVTPAPTSWDVLTDPKYRGRIVAENQPTDLMAMAGIATGAKEPYNMTSDEIARAKEFLAKVKPNILKLVSQNPEVVRALADESAWLAIENLGTDYRVRAAGGPIVKPATPREGIYGFIDGEMCVKGERNLESFIKFINAMEQAPWIAKNFLTYGRPLWNESAYKLLVNQGHKERADALFYNDPERALKMTLKGPSQNEQAYIDAFNEVFGA